MAAQRPLRLYVLDDDPVTREILTTVLEQAGYEVTTDSTSEGAEERIRAHEPDCALLDVMMPGVDGIELCRRLRRHEELRDSRIVFLSGKGYESDRERALRSGADGYFVKPIDPDTFVARLRRLISGELRLRLWGCRGTLPVPGPRTVRYGGNTACVSLSLPGKPLFVFDAGSGIRELSKHLGHGPRERVEVKMLITHPHWDHINAFPFFAPLYAAGNDIEICGPPQGERSMRELMLSQMDGVFFPVTGREFAAHVRFRDLREGSHSIGGVSVRSMLLRHPGSCLGYRIDHRGHSVCYVTDNELFPDPQEPHEVGYLRQLSDFVREADVLVTDCTYTDEEFARRVGWGHSSVSQVVDLAHRADVRKLYLFHHDPDQSDDDVELKLDVAERLLARLGSGVRCFAAREQEEVVL